MNDSTMVVLKVVNGIVRICYTRLYSTVMDLLGMLVTTIMAIHTNHTLLEEPCTVIGVLAFIVIFASIVCWNLTVTI